MGNRLFLVEDDPRLVRALTDLLGDQGYTLEVATNGNDALKVAKSETFDLIILDVMLPFRSGVEVCKELRESGIDAPILMLTARDRVNDKVTGFKSGADDYLTKPFEVDELRARIEALLRRTSRTSRNRTSEYRFGDVIVNFNKLKVTCRDWTTDLTERESRLLRYFIEHRGDIVTRDMLLQEVWGYNPSLYTRTVDVHILRLRQKIEADPKNPQFIVTVHGMGYRFDG
jgi:two-component system alkaline phosphatase synthesis response regulator PhoP